MKVRVYYNRYGKIVSIVEVKTDADHPPAGIFPIPDCESREIELTEDQAETSLILLHTNYSLDLSEGEPRLVPIDTSEEEPRAY